MMKEAKHMIIYVDPEVYKIVRQKAGSLGSSNNVVRALLKLPKLEVKRGRPPMPKEEEKAQPQQPKKRGRKPNPTSVSSK